MGAYLGVGAKSSIYGIYYIQKEECTQAKPRIAVSGWTAWFSPIANNDNRALLVFSTVNDEKKSDFSVNSTVMDNVKLLKWMLKFQFFQQKKYIYINEIYT